MAKEQTERLGRRIRERREELDLKQREVADRMAASPGTDAQMVSKWERGEHRPNDDNLEILAEALETSVADLISGPLAERRQKGPTPDLGATLNGNVPDDLRAELRQVLANQRLLMEYFGIEPDEAGHPTSRFADAFQVRPGSPAKPSRTAASKRT